MANLQEVLTWFTMETLLNAKNNLQFVRNCDGKNLASRFTSDPKVGETINYRKAIRFVPQSGEVHTPQDYIQRSVPVTVQNTVRVGVDFSNRELMFRMNDPHLMEIARTAGETIANEVDRAMLQIAVNNTPHSVGTPAVVPTSAKIYNQARAHQSREGCPMDRRNALLITPDMQVEGVEFGRPIFNPNSDISQQHETGLLAPFYGAKTYECQNLVTHQVGPLGGAPLVNGPNQGLATGWAETGTLVVDGFTAAAALRLRAGDVITIGSGTNGCYQVNAWTRISTGHLQQFTVLADVNSDAAGNATIPIRPALIRGGPYQNINAAPVDNQPILIFGHASDHANKISQEGLRFHKEAFIFGSCDQPTDMGPAVIFAKQVEDKQTALKIRFIKDWDTTNNKEINRFDCVPYFGIAIPEWACRIQGGISA